jgi:hypothetical protein
MSSELVAALAEQFGASEALVQRSAEARAAASGSAIDAILAAWSGGAPAPAAPPDPAPAPTPEPEAAPPEPIATPEEVEEDAAEVAPPPVQAPIPAEPEPIPAGSLNVMLLGSLVLFAIMFIATVIAPSSVGNAATLDAVRTIELSDAAADGRDVYLAEGCAFCHTQQVRPIVTDADLGIVTLSKSPLVPGLQRIGPDLAHIGSREKSGNAGWLAGYLDTPAAFRSNSEHPSFSYLSSRDLENLVTYLAESK